MKLGAAQDSAIWKRSQELSMPFSTVLQRFVLESLLQQISHTPYKEVLWISDSTRLEKSGYQRSLQTTEFNGRLEFYYVESERRIPESQLIPGQKMSRKLLEVMSREIFPEHNRSKILWRVGQIDCRDGIYIVEASGSCLEMTVPVKLQISTLTAGTYVPQKKSFPFIMDEEKMISYLVYPVENILSEHLIEIMEKLELVADMKSYDIVNGILRNQSVSGRHMLEQFAEYAKQHPSFCKEKRLQQLQGYVHYAYMKKRWERYCRNKGISGEGWEQVMELLLQFVKPIWTAFCSNDIFLDDWMPELGRFLS